MMLLRGKTRLLAPPVSEMTPPMVLLVPVILTAPWPRRMPRFGWRLVALLSDRVMPDASWIASARGAAGTAPAAASLVSPTNPCWTISLPVKLLMPLRVRMLLPAPVLVRLPLPLMGPRMLTLYVLEEAPC